MNRLAKKQKKKTLKRVAIQTTIKRLLTCCIKDEV